ncbi:MAG: hypothetical protein AAFQ43_03860 [Bacteroidota bacterium]
MTRYLSLTDRAVRAAAVADATRTGTTTTLDIKRALRRRGYWATQADVSRRLARVASGENWPWWPMGGFRLYGVPARGQQGAAVASRAALVN